MSGNINIKQDSEVINFDGTAMAGKEPGALENMASYYAQASELADETRSMLDAEDYDTEVRKRIEAGSYEGIPAVHLISHGLDALSEKTEAKRQAKRELRKRNEERQQRINEENPYYTAPASHWTNQI